MKNYDCCPVCGSKETSLIIHEDGFYSSGTYFVCAKCGTKYAHNVGYNPNAPKYMLDDSKLNLISEELFDNWPEKYKKLAEYFLNDKDNIFKVIKTFKDKCAITVSAIQRECCVGFNHAHKIFNFLKDTYLITELDKKDTYKINENLADIFLSDLNKISNESLAKLKEDDSIKELEETLKTFKDDSISITNILKKMNVGFVQASYIFNQLKDNDFLIEDKENKTFLVNKEKASAFLDYDTNSNSEFTKEELQELYLLYHQYQKHQAVVDKLCKSFDAMFKKENK